MYCKKKKIRLGLLFKVLFNHNIHTAVMVHVKVTCFIQKLGKL